MLFVKLLHLLLELLLVQLACLFARGLIRELLNAADGKAPLSGPAERFVAEQLVVALGAVRVGEGVVEALGE